MTRKSEDPANAALTASIPGSPLNRQDTKIGLKLPKSLGIHGAPYHNRHDTHDLKSDRSRSDGAKTK